LFEEDRYNFGVKNKLNRKRIRWSKNSLLAKNRCNFGVKMKSTQNFTRYAMGFSDHTSFQLSSPTTTA
jgi:hypothetical protein